MPTLYPIQEAAKLTGVTQSSIHNYTQLYAGFFSKHANPPEGQQRLFTPQDIHLLGFIRKVWEEERTHDNVVARIKRGELEKYQFRPVTARAIEESAQAEELPATALDVPQVRHFGNMLEIVATQVRASHERETSIATENKQMHSVVADLQYKLGQTEGEVASLRSQLEQAEQRSLGSGVAAIWFFVGIIIGLSVPTVTYVLVMLLR